MNRLVSSLASMAILLSSAAFTYGQPHLLKRLQARPLVARPFVGHSSTVTYVPVTIVSTSQPVATVQTVVVPAPSSPLPVAAPSHPLPVATQAGPATASLSPSDLIFGSHAAAGSPSPNPFELPEDVVPSTAVETPTIAYQTVKPSPSPVVTSTIVPVPVIINYGRRPILGRRPVTPSIAPISISLGR